MSKKHFDEYYFQLYSDYVEMINLLKQLEDECATGMVSPDKIENYKNALQPIKDSFLTMQFVKYLLDKPNKKGKIKRYENQTNGIDKDMLNRVSKENRERIGNLKK